MNKKKERFLHVSGAKVERFGKDIKVILEDQEESKTELIIKTEYLNPLIELLIRAHGDAQVAQALPPSPSEVDQPYQDINMAIHVENLDVVKWETGGAAVRLESFDAPPLTAYFQPAQIRFLRDILGHHFGGNIVPTSDTPPTPPPRTEPPIFRGEAQQHKCHLRDGSGVAIQETEVVFPILKKEPNGQMLLVGTGFFISENGLFATARHVLEEHAGEASLYEESLVAVYFLPRDQILFRPILQYSVHDVADVGIGVLAPATHNETGDQLANKVVNLTTQQPSENELIVTYAYPNATHKVGEIRFYPRWYDGTLVKTYPTGRDQNLLPGPCHETSLVIHGGASGGPVFGKNGKVFGINSTGIGSQDVSFVSRVNELLDLHIRDVSLPNEEATRDVTVCELVDLGFVKLDRISS